MTASSLSLAPDIMVHHSPWSQSTHAAPAPEGGAITTISGSKPDVIVSWLQADYGQLGRASESVARALAASGLARKVAYIEPIPATPDNGPHLSGTVRDGLHVYQVHGEPLNALAVGQAVVETSELEDPVLLNFGVGEVNWWFHHALAPWCTRTALVTHDLLHLWPGTPKALSERLAGVRSALVRSSDVVIGLSEGAIKDVPGAKYVGHGIDFGLESAGPPPAEPTDLSKVPRPRALYFGALSVRVDVEALRLLANTGVNVVLLGFAPSAEVQGLISSHPHLYYLGPRSPLESPPYLRHCDVGIVPHTDEPFTWSMEPHKVYNYSAAGLRSVLLNCACPPAFAGQVFEARDPEQFVRAAQRALALGRLPTGQVSGALTHTWASVSRQILSAMDVGVKEMAA